nr:reverse transcriptase domain-containing protein [Tanacetum cinerariifolium]
MMCLLDDPLLHTLSNEIRPNCQLGLGVKSMCGMQKAQQEKLKAVKVCLNFEEASRYSESEAPSRRRNLKKRLRPRYARTRSGSPKPRHDRSKSPREKDPKRRTVFKRLEKGVFHRLGDKEKNVFAHSRGSEQKLYYSSCGDIEICYQSSRSKEIEIAFEKHHHKREYSRRTEAVLKGEGSSGGHWKSKPNKKKSSVDDDLSQPWLLPANTPLVGFSGEIIWPLGQISLLVKICDEEHSTSALMNFMVVRSPSPYNEIIGRPRVKKIPTIPSTAHGMLKFPVAGEIVTLRSSKIIPLECSMVSEPGVSRHIINQVADEKIQVAIHLEYPEQTIAIGSTMTEEGQKELCGLLRRHLNAKEMGQAPESNKAIGKEVKKLVEAGIMKEVHYHSWLSNSVMAHTIVVITDHLIKQLLSNPEVTGRLLKWRFELGEHDIQYRLRTSVKGQILADFIMERPEDDTPNTLIKDREELLDPWILFKDGSSCIDGFGASLIITNPKGIEFTYALRFRFNATNNEVEYEALIAGLQIAGQMGVQNLQVNVDSKLVANQINRIYIAKESSMIKYLEKVKNLASTFKEFFIKQIPRGENKKADALRKIASTSFAHLNKQVLMEQLREKSIDEKKKLTVIEEEGHT